jgi:tricorn protease
MKRSIFAISLLFATAAGAFAQSDKALLLQKPTVSRTHIAFAYAGDLWIVPREGGNATLLTTGVGLETDPCFSPDSRWIAFTGEYDGNTDVYVVAATGGVPRRLTYHPGADVVAGWTPDGRRVLFRSARNSVAGYNQLFTVPAEGGFPDEVPLPMAKEGSFSPDGAHIAYQPLTQWQPDWKRYRGGQTSPIWIARLADSSIEKLPRDNSNDFNPMWIENRVFFLSDRNGAVTLFSYDPASKRVAQVIANNGLDIKSASAGPGAIVYEQFGSIHLLDPKSGKAQKVNITVNADLTGVRPRFERVGTRISSASISPSGARAVFEARGEILSVPAEKGDARNLTNTPGVMERDPAWSPDGKWIAYFSDESGEYALHLRDQTGMGEVKKINLGNPPSFFYSPTWSPDSKKIAYSDKALNLYYIEVAKGTPVKVDKNPLGLRNAVMEPFWSPDSRWIGYIKQVDNHLRAVFVYSLETAKSNQLTDGMSDARYAAFDKSGKYLYFTASTNLGPAFSFAEMSTFPHQSTRSVYAIVLRNDLPSPLAPESDEEKVQEEKKPAEGAQQAAGATPGATPGQADPRAAAQKKEPDPVRIDFDRIGQRIIALPIPARNYIAIVPGKANALYILEPPGQLQPGMNAATIQKYDLEKRKLDKVLDGINGFDLSANGEKLLYRQGQNWFIASLMQPIKPGEGRIKVDDIEAQIDPRAEWQQMYKETWRIERDFFYDPNHHGLDLKATAKKYEPYLDSLAHRADLNYLFQEMLGELTIGHLYVSGGDMPDPKRVPGGLLGADYRVENGRYRFAKIYDGENWNPQLRAPLTQPGVNVQEGEYLLAVNGRNLTASDNIYSFFEATANKQTVIRVGPNPDGAGSREVTVVPVSSESGLRHLAWVEGNRRKVDQMSGGKLAYVYLPDTAQGGYTYFNRYYFSQLNKEGAVIDERFNRGGQAADYIIDYLRKPLMSYWAVRDGEDYRTPFGTMAGPKAMIVNEYAGSGGDLMPWMFRRAQIGPLIGKRTWGGLVGIGGYPQLIDGGSVTAPHFAFYSPEGKWEVENHGVAPDIEVEFDPKAWREGRDPQLEKAVEVVMEELKRNPRSLPKRPAYPNYHSGQTANK